MLKRLLASKPVAAIGSALLAAYIRLVYATGTIKRDPPDTDAKLFDQHPQILAMWHGQFLLLPKLKPTRPADVRAMVSRHADAEIIGAVLERFGMAPDWETNPTLPYGGSIGAKVPFIEIAGLALRTPMQYRSEMRATSGAGPE